MTNTGEASDPKKTIIEQIRASEEALTVTKLAKTLSMSRRVLYEQVERGLLPCIRIGSNIRLDPKLVAEWLEARSIP
jgi:excisionase family DNA binding protein